MNWLGYSIVALITFSGYDLLSRFLGVQSKNPRAYGVVFNFFSALAAFLLLAVEPLKIPTLSVSLLIITLFGMAAWSLFGRFEYYAHKHVEASTLTIIIRLATVINFILSITFLGESLTIIKIIGLMLTLIASVLVVGIPTVSDIKKSKGLSYAFLITLLLGIAWTFDKVLAPVYGVVLISFMNFFIPSVANYASPPLSWSSIKTEFHIGSWKMIISAVINVIGYGAMMKALTLGDASSVIPIATSTSPLVVLGGVVLLNENKDKVKKIVAALLVVLAIYFMR